MRHLDCRYSWGNGKKPKFIYLKKEGRYICEGCKVVVDKTSALRLSSEYFTHDKGV